MLSLYNLLAEIGSILQDRIQSYILYNKISSYSLANEKMFCKFVKIIFSFCFNRWFKGVSFHTGKNMKKRDLGRTILAIAE